MDNDKHELISELGNQAGCIFEDAAPIALTLRRFAMPELRETLIRLELDIRDTLLLITTARRLSERTSRQDPLAPERM
jgi:hypothetical protein